MLQRAKQPRSRSGSIKLGKSSGPRIVTNIRTATKQQIITRHNFYMYEFRTKYCQEFPHFMCKQAKPYSCVKAHYENNIRRRPRLVNGKFNFTDKLCTFASITDCPNSMNCAFSHRVQKEHIYHPSLYKTQLCESPLTEDGICAEFGIHCAKAHGIKDLRQPQYEPDDPRALVHRSGSTSPNCSSDSSADSKSGEHSFQISRTFDENTKELKIHADYMYKFRVTRCLAHTTGQCQFDGNTCFHSHGGENSSRRIPELISGKFNYLPIRCQYMLKGKTCHHAQNCRFAHSKEEVIYHPSKYKTQLCPHRLKKVQVIRQPGGVPNQANESNSMDGGSPSADGKTTEMWVCAGYGIHCAKAHGKDDLRLPVFENCSKEMPVKPMPPPSHQHYRSVAHPSENNSNNAIFRPTGMSHRRNSHNGGGSDMIPSSNNTIYRSMNMRTMSDKISTKHRHHSDEVHHPHPHRAHRHPSSASNFAWSSSATLSHSSNSVIGGDRRHHHHHHHHRHHHYQQQHRHHHQQQQHHHQRINSSPFRQTSWSMHTKPHSAPNSHGSVGHHNLTSRHQETRSVYLSRGGGEGGSGGTRESLGNPSSYGTKSHSYGHQHHRHPHLNRHHDSPSGSPRLHSFAGGGSGSSGGVGIKPRSESADDHPGSSSSPFLSFRGSKSTLLHHTGGKSIMIDDAADDMRAISSHLFNLGISPPSSKSSSRDHQGGGGGGGFCVDKFQQQQQKKKKKEYNKPIGADRQHHASAPNSSSSSSASSSSQPSHNHQYFTTPSSSSSSSSSSSTTTTTTITTPATSTTSSGATTTTAPVTNTSGGSGKLATYLPSFLVSFVKE